MNGISASSKANPERITQRNIIVENQDYNKCYQNNESGNYEEESETEDQFKEMLKFEEDKLLRKKSY
jgi:hypothetical protein